MGSMPPLDLRQTLIERFGETAIKGSMVGHQKHLSPLLEALNPKVVVEIGTFQGASAALWALYCDFVITIDIRAARDAVAFWKHLGVENKIAAVQVANDEAKRRFVSGLKYDFAFVDGAHTADGVRIDFECVRSAAAVLFHDYKPEGGQYAACTNHRFPDVAAFIDSLEPSVITFGPRCSKLAVWLNPARVDEETRGRIEGAMAPQVGS